MAEGKKSFLFYTNWGNTFDELSDDDAGKLIKHICDYVRDKNPQTDSILIKAVFANIKSILKMDLDKWEAKSLKNSENAKMRWDKKDTNACERIKPNANHADIVNDIDNDNDNDNVKEKKTNIPALQDFLIYSKTLEIYHPSFDFQIKAKWNSWKESGWKDGNNKKILNWKTKLQNTMPYFKKDFSIIDSSVKKVDPKTIVL